MDVVHVVDDPSAATQAKPSVLEVQVTYIAVAGSDNVAVEGIVLHHLLVGWIAQGVAEPGVARRGAVVRGKDVATQSFLNHLLILFAVLVFHFGRCIEIGCDGWWAGCRWGGW